MSMRIVLWGDIYLGNLQVQKEISNQIFAHVKEINSKSDLVIANLEAVISDDEEFKGILKTGPNMKMSSSWCGIIKEAGIDILTLANNHVGDYGEEGVINTISKLQEAGIKTVGAGSNIEEAYRPIHLCINGEKISVLAACENEFGVAENEKVGVAGLDEVKLLELIKGEKNNGYTVIVLFHGGMEFCPLPSPDARVRYRRMIDYGATLVAATHTHCPQGFEEYNNGFISYSMGNFIFHDASRARSKAWNSGYGIELLLEKSEIGKVNLIPYYYDTNKLILKIHSNKDGFLDYLKQISAPIKDNETIEKFYIAWCILYSNDYANFINNGNDGRLDIEIENLFRCESHRERMLTFFKERRNFNKDEYKDILEKLEAFEKIPGMQ